MRAAIYARKSTDDDSKTPDNKSVERQVQHATAYAVSKGWEVLPEHIFIDDNISGAEYVNRPSLFRLLDHLKDFDKLIMSESSRLGRDMTRNSYYLMTIIEAGTEVYYYMTDEQEKADSPEARLMLTLKSYASEVERQKASERSRDALKRRAAKGLVTGGVCFGYDNIDIFTTSASGEKTKAHSEYKINEEQADIIRRIYRMYADGYGHSVICKTLNGNPRHHKLSLKYFDGQTPTPPARKNSAGSWSISAIYYMLRNAKYVGIISFSRRRQVYRGGTKKSEKQSEYFTTTREDLRIISPELWKAAQKRIKDTAGKYLRSTDGHLESKPENGRHSKYLLSSLTRCECGGSMIGAYRHIDSKLTKEHYYVCSRYTNRGRAVCSNSLKPKMKELDSLILDAIKTSVLDADAIRYVVEKAMAEVGRLRKAQPHKGETLEKELKKAEKELRNLVAAIASGNAPKTVLEAIKAKESKVESLRAELSRYHAPVQMNDLDYKRLEKDLSERLVRFETLIFSDTTIARQALRKLFKKPLTLKSDGNGGYTVEGETSLGSLFASPKIVTTGNPSLTQPTG